MAQATTALILWVLLTPVVMIWRGYVLSILWAWFVVPFGLPPLGIAGAIGLSYVVSLMSGVAYIDPLNDDDEPLERLLKAAGMAFFVPALGLLLGWIVAGFVP